MYRHHKCMIANLLFRKPLCNLISQVFVPYCIGNSWKFCYWINFDWFYRKSKWLEVITKDFVGHLFESCACAIQPEVPYIFQAECNEDPEYEGVLWCKLDFHSPLNSNKRLSSKPKQPSCFKMHFVRHNGKRITNSFTRGTSSLSASSNSHNSHYYTF